MNLARVDTASFFDQILGNRARFHRKSCIYGSLLYVSRRLIYWCVIFQPLSELQLNP